ncbi:MAG: ATP synthase F1 subunit gamma [Actinobacteria bacterium]|nr:ATP synthase F1 subunit gamma [Actinomycetota bacterium]
MEKSEDIRNRIKSIKGTRKITKAMEMIASSKIRKAQHRINEARGFIEGIENVIMDIACFSSTVADPLLAEPEIDNKVLLMGVTADRGLCGGYNVNIIRLIEKMIAALEKSQRSVTLEIIGTRGKNYFNYMGYKVARSYENMSDYPKFLDAREISKDLMSRFLSGQANRVFICYTKFKNPAEIYPTVRQLFPISIYESEIPSNILNSKNLEVFIDRFGRNYSSEGNLNSGADKVMGRSRGTVDTLIGGRVCRLRPEFIYDPSLQEVLGSMLPEYIYSVVYGILLESTASETGARMTAMKTASENADEIINGLTLMYHRARQQQITMEISEIVSGFESFNVSAD